MRDITLELIEETRVSALDGQVIEEYKDSGLLDIGVRLSDGDTEQKAESKRYD